MKKLLMIAVMFLSSTAMFAEQGDMWVGANANYGMHSDYKNLGIGAKIQWEFMDNIRVEPSFNYYFKKDLCTMYDVNINGHYLINAGGLTIYPLAGVTLLGTKVTVPAINVMGYNTPEVSASDSNLGLNVGGGVEFPISDGIKLNAEFKYQIVKDWNRPVISVGAAFAL